MIGSLGNGRVGKTVDSWLLSELESFFA